MSVKAITKTKQKSKQSIAWGQIIKDFNLIDAINKNGNAQLWSNDITPYGEVRLMTSIRSFEELCQLLQDKKLVPILLGKRDHNKTIYTIGHYKIFHTLEKIKNTVVWTNTSNLESEKCLSIKDIKKLKEGPAFSFAVNCGIIADFMESGNLNTVDSGRHATSEFTYKIKNGSKSEILTINKAQIEIDEAIETQNGQYLVEKKCGNKKTISLAQLYYPYRYELARGYGNKLPLKNIVCVYANGVYKLYEYKFSKVDDINSIQLIKSKEYHLAIVKKSTKGIAA